MRMPLPAVLAALCLAAAAPAVRAEGLLIRGATLIDGTGAEPRAGVSVVVRDGRIEAVGPAEEIGTPDDVRIVPAEGAYLIPGLWDSAAQLDDSETWQYSPPDGEKERVLSLCLAAGVTGVRCFGGDLGLQHAWRARIELGELAGPRLLCGGPWLDGSPPVKPGARVAANANLGAHALDEVAESGADFAPVYSKLRADVFLAIAARARSRGFPLAGRVPQLVDVLQATEAGLAVQVSLGAYVRGMYDHEAMRKRIMAIPVELPPEERRLRQIDTFFGGIEPELRDRLLATLRDAGVFVVPTLVVQQRRGTLDPTDPRVRPYLPFVPEHLREWWKPANNPDLRNLSEGWKAGEARIFEHYVEMVGHMHAAGVQLLVGTDCGSNPLVVPGFAVHDELELLVSAGLTPMEALRAATALPARSLGLAADLGTVEEGKLADLVLLEADPLEDIANTRRVRAVVAAGRIYDRERLSQLLAVPGETMTLPARVGPDGKLQVVGPPK